MPSSGRPASSPRPCRSTPRASTSPRWRRAIAAVRLGVDLGVSSVDQLALADFLASGAMDRHLRRTRQRYAARRAALLEALQRELPGARVTGVAAGLHAVALLPAGTDEE